MISLKPIGIWCSNWRSSSRFCKSPPQNQSGGPQNFKFTKHHESIPPACLPSTNQTATTAAILNPSEDTMDKDKLPINPGNYTIYYDVIDWCHWTTSSDLDPPIHSWFHFFFPTPPFCILFPLNRMTLVPWWFALHAILSRPTSYPLIVHNPEDEAADEKFSTICELV